MNKIKLFPLLVTLLFMSHIVVMGQGSKLSKADKLYEELDFWAAIPLYKSLLKSNNSSSIKEKLANAYRLVNDSRNSEKWLQEVVKEGGSNDIYKLYYGQSLMQNEKYAEAEYWLSQFVSSNPSHSQASNLLNAAQNIRELRKSNSGCSCQALPREVNSKCSDIGPSFYQDGIMFSSDCDSSGLKYTSCWTGRSFYDLFTATDNGDNNYTKRKRGKYGSVGTNKFHEGPISFSSDENTMYYTRNNFEKGGAGIGRDGNGSVRLKIFEAENQGGKWVTVGGLPVNSDNYSVCHPALTKDGTRLYFSSDMPGGYGGMDLYMLERSGSSWGSATNLGPSINTEGDEVFPYHHSSGNLYFSSNGLATSGGLDVFKVSERSGKPMNMGSPINTPKDDFGYILSEDESKSYLSSNRNESRVGDDDIYSCNCTCSSSYMRGLVVDCQSDSPISGANVSVSGLGDVTTNADGTFSFEVKSEMNYTVGGSKAGYNSENVSVSTSGMDCGEEVFVKVPICAEVVAPACAPYGTACDDYNASTVNDIEDGNCNCRGSYVETTQPTACYISGRVFDQSTGQSLSGVRVKLRDSSTGFEQEAYTGVDGYYSFLNDGGNYNLSTTAECYYAETQNTSYNECNMTMDFPMRGIQVGSVSLLNIYYDLNKWNIRNDAEGELSKLYTFMVENPGVTVQLNSHTDSRGSDSFNQTLSQNRANSVRDWLIARGVDGNRITSVGYGESQLVNECSNGVSCSDKRHQENRRTEFVITGGCGNYVSTGYQNYQPYIQPSQYSIDK